MNVVNRRCAQVVASKIANLWKQVEESRTKQKSDQPDARKWISRGTDSLAKPLTFEKGVGTTGSVGDATSPGNVSNSGKRENDVAIAT